ncbi:MAG: EamA family transporter, partial [Candidatus Binatia bacterium]
PVSLISFVAYLSLPTTTERLVWNQWAFWPFMWASLFETLGILFMLTAFVSGPVVLVSPITATSPIWTLLMSSIFLRDLERINLNSIIGTLCVVVGVIAVYLSD